MRLPALSGPTLARGLRHAVLAIGAAVLLVLPQFSTNASFMGVTGLPGPVVVLALGLALALMPVLVVCSWVAERRATMPAPWLAVPAVLFVVGVAVSTCFASDKSTALVRGAEMAGLWVGLAALVQAIRTDAQRRFLLSVLVAAAVVLAAVAVYQAAVGLPKTWAMFQADRERILAERGIAPGSWHEQMFIGRFFGGVQASMGHPNVLASFLTLGFFVAVGLAREKWSEAGSRGARVLAAVMVVVAGVCALGIILTQSRAAVAAVLVGLYWLAAAWRVRQRRRRIVLYLMPLVVAAVGLAAASQVDHPAVQAVLKTLRYRLDYWWATLKILGLYWDRGVGLENFGHHYVEYKVAWAPEEVADPHNMFLSVWSQLGLAGVTALVLLAAGAIRSWLRGAPPTGRPTMPDVARRPSQAAASEAVGGSVAAWEGRHAEGVEPPPGEPLLGLLVPAMLLGGPVVIYFFMMGWYVGVAAAAVMVMVAGLASGEEPSRLEASGRPLRSLRTACVVALAAFALQEQIGTAVLAPPTAWAMLVVLGVSLRPRGPRPESGGVALGAAARFLLMIAVMAMCFGYVRLLVLPVAREQMLLRVGDWGLDAFGGGEPLRAAAEANPLAWEPAVIRGHQWQKGAASKEGPAAAIDLEMAIRAYRDAVQRHPRLRSAYLALAECYLASAGAHENPAALATARDYLEEAARLYPTHVATRLRLAHVLERMGETEAAVTAYREAQGLDALMPEAGRRLRPQVRAWIEARIAELVGDRAAALRAYREVVRLDDLETSADRRLDDDRRIDIECRIAELEDAAVPPEDAPEALPAPPPAGK